MKNEILQGNKFQIVDNLISTALRIFDGNRLSATLPTHFPPVAPWAHYRSTEIWFWKIPEIAAEAGNKSIPAPSHPEAQIPQANRQPLTWPTIGVSCDWPGRKSGRCVICTADNKRGLRRCCCCCCCYCCCCWSAVQPALMSIFSHCAN